MIKLYTSTDSVIIGYDNDLSRVRRLATPNPMAMKYKLFSGKTLLKMPSARC